MSKERLARCAACGERAPTLAAYCPACGVASGRAAWLAAAAARLTAGVLVVASAALGETLLGVAVDRWAALSKPSALALGALSTLARIAGPVAAGVAAALFVRASGAKRLPVRAGWALAALGLTAVALAAGGRGLSLDAVAAARLGLAAVSAALGATVALPVLACAARVAPFSWVARRARPTSASGGLSAALAVVAAGLAMVLVPWLVAWIFAADAAASLGRDPARVRSAGAGEGSRGQEAT